MRDLQADKLICEKATKGPWEVIKGDGDCQRIDPCPRGLEYCDDDCHKCEDWKWYSAEWLQGPKFIECGDYSYFTVEDAQFIAAAREGWPEAINRAISAEAEVAKLKTVLEERIADINAVLDDNESHRALKFTMDMAFMEQRKRIEQYRQALNRVLGFVVDCPSHQGLTDGTSLCGGEYKAGQCVECWKVALGVEEDD